MKIDINRVSDKIKSFVESNKFKVLIYILASFFILMFVFQAGMIAGFKKASFGNNWGENYERNFGPSRNKLPLFMDGMRDMPNAHGAIGKIIKVDFPNIVVLDKDQTEKVIIISDTTNILERKEVISKDKLILDKYIIVIGSPNDSGQIESKLIRIIPSPEDMLDNKSDFNKDMMPKIEGTKR